VSSVAVDPARFGTDLRLLANLERQAERERGSDLRSRGSPGDRGADLETVTGAENLQQALLMRFTTRVGELTDLGHPTYGSRLPELIGERNTEANRNLVKLFVLRSLAEEPRVREVLSLAVRTDPRDRTLVTVAATLATLDSDSVVNLVFPFFLEGGAPE
jgi:phage baseplate assembly protein W